MSVLARLFVLVAIAVLPALAIQAYNEYDLRREREVEVRREALRLATFAAGELDRIVENGRGLLFALATLPAVREGDAASCSAYFAELKRLLPHYTVISAIDAGGTPFCSSAPVPGRVSIADRAYWRRAIETGEFTIGEYTVGRVLPARVLPLALAFRDMAGRVGGVVILSLDLDWLAEYFAQKPFNENATLAVSDRDATVLLRLPDNPRYVGTKFADPYLRYIYAEQPGTDEIVGIDGVPRILGYVPLTTAPGGLYVGIGLTKDAAFALVDRATRTGAALISAGLVLALLAAWLGGRRFISTPIRRLAAAASHWRRGDFAVRVAKRGGGEVALLADAFNDMAAELAAKQQENAALLVNLEQRVAERTRALEQEVEERRKAEDALVQAQKMEAIGQLTGGIAHDFNNLLTAVIGNLELARDRVAGGEGRLTTLIGGALRAAERGARLTQGLLAFARRQHLAPEALDPAALVDGVRDLLSHSIGPEIRLGVAVGPAAWPVRADRNQLELALLNLVVNARDAMPFGGSIVIAVHNRTLEARDDALPRGDYVVIQVADTGTGMSEEVAAHVFEPFFTTKETGKGSGLGLSMVQGFAVQSGGTVRLRSAPGEGTTVEIWLPRAPAAEAAREEAPPAAAGRSTGRLLVCDDDPDVRELVAKSLTAAGYSVVETSSGAAAIRIAEQDRRFDAAIIDYAMPEMNGTAVAEALHRAHPGLPVLLVTGYVEAEAAAGGPANHPVLRKPFKPAELVARVAELIGRAASRSAAIVRLRPGQP
jgi:signal transduction histidine kinase